MSDDLIDRYLSQLRHALRVPRHRKAAILAEAEDHLRESAAAGLAIGMTETEAQEAAISAFGSVRAVVRANRRRREALAATAAGAGLVTWKLAGLFLTVFGAVSLAGLAETAVRAGVPRAALAEHAIALILGVALLGSNRVARTAVAHKRGYVAAPLDGRAFPLLAASAFGAVAALLALLGIYDPAGPLGWTILLLTVVYATQAWRLRHAAA